jgi:hypothetical protein
MTYQQLVAFHTKTCETARSLISSKNHDYASKDDALKNIEDAANNCGITPVQGCWTRASDKFSRISNFIKNGVLKVENEKIEDTIHDMINYLVFTLALIHEAKENDESFSVGELLFNPPDAKNIKVRLSTIDIIPEIIQTKNSRTETYTIIDNNGTVLGHLDKELPVGNIIVVNKDISSGDDND